jgi:hypothetical protein
LDGNKIDCEKEVKLLGVTIDCQLKFNTHISNICKKASRQLNVLKRIGKHLTTFINKSEGPFLNFFNFSGIGLTTEMPNNWTIIKITHYKRKIYS